MTESKRPQGMSAFIVVWIGQLVSLLGTQMTVFALTIWAFEQTGRATDLALLGFFFMTPLIFASPLTGALVDRSNRKLMMMLSDLAAGIVTLVVLFLYTSGSLEIWHLYIANAISGFFQSFQWPAYSAAITVMLDKKHYTRANSMMELANSASNIFAPLAAGALLGFIGLQSIMLIDVITFVVAISTLLLVVIPQPDVSEQAQAAAGNTLLQDSLFGFRYLLDHRPLLWLQVIFMLGNFLFTLSFTLFAAMILASTASNEIVLGTVQTIGAVGSVLGGVVISAWGGFRRNINGVLFGWALSGSALIIVGLGRPEPLTAGIIVWGLGLFVGSFAGPLINASNQSIWMSKVPPDLHGRVFSIRRLVAWLVIPLSQLIAGPLADNALEPAMQAGGRLVPVFGWLVGSGPGAGMSLVYIFAGVLMMLIGLGSFANPQVRNVETLLPDHSATEAQTSPA